MVSARVGIAELDSAYTAYPNTHERRLQQRRSVSQLTTCRLNAADKVHDLLCSGRDGRVEAECRLGQRDRRV